MKNFKTYFIDLDGTLCDNKRYPSSKNILKIREKIKSKTKIVLSTGRLDNSVFEIMKMTGVKYAILGNGSKILNAQGNTLRDFPLDWQKISQLMQIIKKDKLLIKIDGDFIAYGVESFIQKRIIKVMKYTPIWHYNFPKDNQIFKIVIFGKTKKQILKITNKIQESITDINVINSFKGYTIEVTSSKASKGLALQFVSKNILKIRDQTTVAHIGDSMNDSTVVPFASLIAMGNSSKRLFSYAKYKGPKYKKAGVAKILDGKIKPINES